MYGHVHISRKMLIELCWVGLYWRWIDYKPVIRKAALCFRNVQHVHRNNSLTNSHMTSQSYNKPLLFYIVFTPPLQSLKTKEKKRKEMNFRVQILVVCVCTSVYIYRLFNPEIWVKKHWIWTVKFLILNDFETIV